MSIRGRTVLIKVQKMLALLISATFDSFTKQKVRTGSSASPVIINEYLPLPIFLPRTSQPENLNFGYLVERRKLGKYTYKFTSSTSCIGDAYCVHGGAQGMANLTLDKKRTLITLWSIAKSPMMLGGDVRNFDDTTFDLLTNPKLLEIKSYSSNNKELIYIKPQGVRSWIATGRKGEIYVAFFNLNSETTTITATKSDLAKALSGTKSTVWATSCNGTEIWSRHELGTMSHSISFAVQPHGTALFVLHCN